MKSGQWELTVMGIVCMGKSRNKKSAGSRRPTDAELAILNVLWDSGPSTVRQVQERLESERGTGYTTTLKLMQIMFAKGLLHRDESGHAHVYRSAVSKKRTQRQIIAQVVDQVFNGSAQQLVLQALAARESTASELDEIRRLLDDLERNTK